MSPIIKEEKIFIDGPSGQIESLIYGLPGINEKPNSRYGEHTNDAHYKTSKPNDNSKFNNNTSAIKTIGVFCHPHPLYQGTMNNKVVTTACKAWQNLGLPTLRFNFRGVGESMGTYDNGVGEKLDLEAVLTFLQKVFPKIQFFLGGFSFGSYIALQVAAKVNPFPIRALLTIAPPVHHFTFDKTLLPSCPWVLIQGTNDTVAPYEKVLDWVNALKLKKTDLQFISMEGAEHFFHGRLIELNTIIQDCFRSFL